MRPPERSGWVGFRTRLIHSGGSSRRLATAPVAVKAAHAEPESRVSPGVPALSGTLDVLGVSAVPESRGR